MLSYQHAYHAGNFADVLKHLVLVLIADYMTQKDKPLFYLETHAGRGMYDLKEAMAQKTGEFHQGIERLYQHRAECPDVFASYLNSIEQLNQGTLRYYPGSPALATRHLRPMDRLYACELHPKEFDLLKKLPSLGRRLHSEHTDGMQALSALMPPPEKRGLIFIDPAYELKEEYKTIPRAIANAYQRFSQGVFALWYPIVNEYHQKILNSEMEKINAEKKLHITFHPGIAELEGMTGMGMWIINPPYQLKQQLTDALEYMCRIWPQGRYSLC